VVVEMDSGCDVAAAGEPDLVGVIVVVVVVVAVPVGVPVGVEVGGATRMQQRTPRLRLRAPSTPTCKGAGGSFLLTFSRRMLALSYSSPSCGMNRSNPESGVAAVGKREPHAESVIF